MWNTAFTMTKSLILFSNIAKHKINIPSAQIHSCICGNLYLRRDRQISKNIRVHSTQTDQHRQKVAVETATPKIVLDKLTLDKVLPVEKGLEHVTRLQMIREKIDPYIKLARWDKPIGVYLLFWPCSWSIAIASVDGTIPLRTSLELAGLFLVGAGLMRGAGCTINDLWDRDIDRQVERTKDRPLVAGTVSTKQAVAFLGAQLSLALCVLLQLNCFSVLLGASSMALVVTYPLAKRWCAWPQLVLGATFSWGALLGAAATRAALPASACALYVAAVAWTVMYDTIYAHQDKIDDARIGIKSTALSFGSATRPALSGVLFMSAGALAAAGHLAGLGALHHAGVAAFVLHAATQIYTLDVDNPSDCAEKFKSNSWVGLIVLLGIIGGGYEQYLINREKNAPNDEMNIRKTKGCLFQ